MVCGILVWQINQLNQRNEWVEHTHTVISQVHLAQRLLLDQETGLRGFILTRSPEFLEPYQQGRYKFEQIFGTLRTLTADSQVQQQRLEELQRQHASWQARAEQQVAEVRVGGQSLLNEAALAEARRRSSLMQAMRASSAAFVAEEQRLLDERRNQARTARQSLILSSAVALAVAGILLGWYLWRLVGFVDRTYQRALSEREASLKSEQQARAAAEAIAAEVTERSLEMEREYAKVRTERDRARERLTAEGRV